MIFNTRHLKAQTILYDFQHCLRNIHIQVNKDRTALCVSLKGSKITTKNFLRRILIVHQVCKAISSCLYKVCVHGEFVNQEEQRNWVIISSGKQILILNFRFTKLMLFLGYLSGNPQIFHFWNAQVLFIRLGPVRR